MDFSNKSHCNVLMASTLCGPPVRMFPILVVLPGLNNVQETKKKSHIAINLTDIVMSHSFSGNGSIFFFFHISGRVPVHLENIICRLGLLCSTK